MALEALSLGYATGFPIFIYLVEQGTICMKLRPSLAFNRHLKDNSNCSTTIAWLKTISLLYSGLYYLVKVIEL